MDVIRAHKGTVARENFAQPRRSELSLREAKTDGSATVCTSAPYSTLAESTALSEYVLLAQFAVIAFDCAPGPVPRAFVAVTVSVYIAPFVSPMTVPVVALPTTCALAPPGVATTL